MWDSSALQYIAINPHGADGDELTAHESIADSIGIQTAFNLMNPREIPIPEPSEEKPVEV